MLSASYSWCDAAGPDELWYTAALNAAVSLKCELTSAACWHVSEEGHLPDYLITTKHALKCRVLSCRHQNRPKQKVLERYLKTNICLVEERERRLNYQMLFLNVLFTKLLSRQGTIYMIFCRKTVIESWLSNTGVLLQGSESESSEVSWPLSKCFDNLKDIKESWFRKYPVEPTFGTQP